MRERCEGSDRVIVVPESVETFRLLMCPVCSRANLGALDVRRDGEGRLTAAVPRHSPRPIAPEDIGTPVFQAADCRER